MIRREGNPETPHAGTEVLAAALREDWDEVQWQLRVELLPGELAQFGNAVRELNRLIELESARRAGLR